MVNAVTEALNTKTTSQYMIIEDRYLILKRCLKILINENRVNKNSIKDILLALDDEPISIIEENK